MSPNKAISTQNESGLINRYADNPCQFFKFKTVKISEIEHNRFSSPHF